MELLAILLFAVALLVVSGGFAWREQALTPAASEFLRYVASIVRRGYPLGNAIRVFASEKSSVHQFGAHDQLLDLADKLDAGESLSDAMEAHSDHFPPYVAALARAGERGGNLDRILDRVTSSAETDHALTQRSAGYVTYGLMVSLNVTIVMAVIVPYMGRVFYWLGFEPGGVPWAWVRYLPLVSLALFVVMAGIATVSVPYVPWKPRFGWLRRLRTRRRQGLYRRAAVWAMWRSPLVGKCVKRRAVSRFSFVASELLRAGVPLDETLELAARASGNPHMEAIGIAAAGRARDGESIAAALVGADADGHLPRDFLWFVETGAHSGDLPGALERAAETSAVRSRFALGVLVRAVAPLSIVVLGVLVGIVGMTMFGGFVHIMGGM